MKEEEIRPKKIFDEYLRLTALDTHAYFSGVASLPISCPACGTQGHFQFQKLGFSYELCPNCDTLYVSPRPKKESFTDYYTNSSSAKFWADVFYKKTAEARKEKLWKPKASLILELLSRYKCNEHILVDIGGGYGLFAQLIQETSTRKCIVIEPNPHLAKHCKDKGLAVVQKFLEEIDCHDLPNTPKVFVSFELFEHLHDVDEFVNTLKLLMREGDYFIFSTLSSTGVDIRTLWDKSKSVSPPHHLNFFNPFSIQLLLTRLGFDCLDVSTPGKIDIDIMSNNREQIEDRFWKAFISHASVKQKATFQKFLSDNGWSSHMMTICKLADQ